MRDGLALRFVKAVARGLTWLEVSVRRAWARRRGEPRYRLLNTCNGCGRCCETPTIQVDAITWRLSTARALFLWWQRRVNGMTLLSVDARFRLFAFSCSHYDRASRRCDSYESRPFFCRDYPVNVTFDPVPQLFADCSHQVVDRNAETLLAAMRHAGVSAEKLEQARQKLYLGGAGDPRPQDDATKIP